MKTLLSILLICLLAFGSVAKTFSSFTLTVSHRFYKAGIPNVQVKLYSIGEKSTTPKVLYTDQYGRVVFDSLTKGHYSFNCSLPGSEYQEEYGMIAIEDGKSIEKKLEMDLTQKGKEEILKPYLMTELDLNAYNLEIEANKSCYDLENRELGYGVGNEQLKTDAMDFVRYPQEAIESEIEGKVLVTFLVDETGKIIKLTVKKPVNQLLDTEAMFALLLVGKFETYVCNGKPLKALFSLPMTFRLS